MEFLGIVVPLLLSLHYLVEFTQAGKYQLVHQIETSWNDSKADCDNRNRRFAIIASKADMNWVKTLKPYFHGSFWIGMKREENESIFKWHDSTEVTYQNWAAGYPSAATSGDELCVFARADDFAWVTEECTAKKKYLCENIHYKHSGTVDEKTQVKGVFLGLAAITGLLVVCCLLLQLPCFTTNVSEKIAYIGFGTKE